MNASGDSAAPNEGGDATPEPAWGLGRRVAFRFAALYVFLWLAPWPLPTELLEKALGVKISGLSSDALVTWVGMDVLGIAGTYEAWSASGDTAYRWVFHLIIVVLAGIGAVAWGAVARRRSHHHRGYIWLVVYLRFYLAGQMLGYGLSKVAGHQFGDGGHTVARLYTALGDLTPTQLLWEFMGHSWVYSGFTGLAEVVGGALLFARRTTTLGALLLVAVLSNVFLLNLLYDIPVKLFSGHLLVIAVFLLARDAGPLIDLFVRGRSAQLRALPEPTTTRRGAKIWRLVRILVIAELVLFPVVQQLGSKLYRTFRAPAPHALAGAYQVEVFVRDGRVVPTSAAGSERWDLFIMDPSGRPKIRRGDGSFETFWSYPVAADVSTVELRRVIDEATKEHVAAGELRLQESGGRVLVDGELDGVAVRAELAPSARRFALAEATIRLRQGG